MESSIKHLFDEIKDKGILALAHMSEENQTILTSWAQDIFDRYESVLESHPTKIKNIVELPASKQEVKMALKIMLTAYVLKQSDEMVDKLKDCYISIGAFQDIDREDKEKIIEQINNIKRESDIDYSTVFPESHKYLQVIISEQNVLLDDVNAFIHDLKKLRQKP